jgi:hypothetical protein
MSAAAAVLVEAPTFFEAVSVVEPVAEPMPQVSMRDFIHDLRQPLSSMEAIAYYLEMTLPAEQQQARQYMRRLQQLVDEANQILHHAAVEAR